MSQILVISSSRRCYIELSADPGVWTVRRYVMELGIRKCISTDTFATRQPALEFAEGMKREYNNFLTSNS
jgi:hypothetical protein